MQELTDFWLATERDPKTMWESWKDPHRDKVLLALSCLPEFKSLYELGCGSGPNLRAIQSRRPGITLGGSEPNPGLAAWASEHLGVSIDRWALPDIPDSPWDVTLSCYAMAYVDVPTVTQVLTQVTSPHFVIIEPTAYVLPFETAGLYTGHAMPCYVHDYQGLAESQGWRTLWRWPIVPHYQGLNAVLILERT